MKRASLAAVALLLAPVVSWANNILEDSYTFPVISKTAGVAGTQWLTELCISNPSDQQLNIKFVAVKNGEWWNVMGYYFLPQESHCWQDAVASVFSDTGSMGLLLSAPSDMNPGVEDRRFAASVKIYNNASSGTYGQEIPPVSPRNPWALLSGSTALIPGIQNHGVAGQSGFRTNIGLFNSGGETDTVEVYLHSDNGNLLWSRQVSLDGYSLTQFAVPSSISVHDGIVTVVVDGPSPVIAYASIVDNRTGDGSLRNTYIDIGPAR